MTRSISHLLLSYHVADLFARRTTENNAGAPKAVADKEIFPPGTYRHSKGRIQKKGSISSAT